MSSVLMVVSEAVPRNPKGVAGPRKDFVELARSLDAQILEPVMATRSIFGRLVARALGLPIALAWSAFWRRKHYQVILTDGEHIGIPLALLLKLVGASIAHVTVGHRISARKKQPFFRWLKIQTHITRIALHAQRQYELVVTELKVPAEQLALVPYQVDTQFWRPQPVTEERLICSAGREFRDYPTLFRAVDGLDVKVVVGAASHWSRRRNTAQTAKPPTNVEVDAFDYQALRALYARAAVVVVPLDDVDFQAGVTTILEAMAMAKPVIVSHTWGQTDVIEDRRATTRGSHPRLRPVGLLRQLAEQAGFEPEPNGFYVPPNDAAALRRAIQYLLDHPAERAQLGVAGRRTVERLATLEHYVERLTRLVKEAQYA